MSDKPITLHRISFDVNEWKQNKNTIDFIGIEQENKQPVYTISISKYNYKRPNIYSIKVEVIKTIGVYDIYSFIAKTTSVYEQLIPFKSKPQVELLWVFIQRSAFDFWQEYTKRTKDTSYQFLTINPPILDDMKAEIQKYIDNWGFHVRQLPLN